MSIEEHSYKRDKAGLRHYACCDCGKERPDYMIFERRGNLFCGDCLTATAERKAYETWFVRDGEEATSAPVPHDGLTTSVVKESLTTADNNQEKT